MPILRVDLDALADVALGDAMDGQRVWLEVMRHGQVVGVKEARVRAGRVSKESLAQVTSDLATIEVTPRSRVLDHLLPRATVVVPTLCQRPEELVRTVETILAQDYPDYEVIIVDNRRDLRSPFPSFAYGDRVRVLREPRRGASFARNRGIDNATGEFVAFTDDDVAVDANWLRELGTIFVQSPQVDGISGLVLPLELRTLPQLWFEEFFGGFNKSFSPELMSMELLAGVDEMFPYSPGRFGAGCNMAFRRSALVREGGFDVLLGAGTLARGGEDLALCLKHVLSGGTLAFEPRAIVHHRHRESEDEFLTQVFGYGAGLTAMFTALIVHDPRHVSRMIRRIPGGYRLLTKPRNDRSASLSASYPFGVYVKHWSGLAYGPLAYARSAVRNCLDRPR
jgi:GT2 family glycosyltransferase